jgi:hypothetical protein
LEIKTYNYFADGYKYVPITLEDDKKFRLSEVDTLHFLRKGNSYTGSQFSPHWLFNKTLGIYLIYYGSYYVGDSGDHPSGPTEMVCRIGTVDQAVQVLFPEFDFEGSEDRTKYVVTWTSINRLNRLIAGSWTDDEIIQLAKKLMPVIKEIGIREWNHLGERMHFSFNINF